MSGRAGAVSFLSVVRHGAASARRDSTWAQTIQATGRGGTNPFPPCLQPDRGLGASESKDLELSREGVGL